MIVSGGQQRDSAIHIHLSILPQAPFPSRLPDNIEQSLLYYTVGYCWLSILNIAACTCPSQTPCQEGIFLTTGPPGKYQEGIVFLTSGPETTEQPYAKNK